MRQVGGIERIQREIRTLRHLLRVPIVLRVPKTELQAGPRSIVKLIETIDLAVRFLVFGLGRARAENPVERRAREARRIAIRKTDIGRRRDAVEAVRGASVEHITFEHVLLRRLADASRVADLAVE